MAERQPTRSRTIPHRWAIAETLAVGTGDQPFGSVTVHDIATMLQQAGLPVEKSAIQLEQPIKTLGIYEVPVRLQANVSARLKVSVVKQ